jgi:hypothetical protein
MGEAKDYSVSAPQLPHPPPPILTPNEALEMRVRVAERAHDVETEFGTAANAAAIKNAEEVIKAATLINGGGSVAMLAFIGTLVSRDVLSSEQLVNITKPLLCFGCGVAASIIASAAAYLTNLFIANTSNERQREYEQPFVRNTPASIRSKRLGELFRWIAILFIPASISCFIWGLVSAGTAFSNLTPLKPMIGDHLRIDAIITKLAPSPPDG